MRTTLHEVRFDAPFNTTSGRMAMTVDGFMTGTPGLAVHLNIGACCVAGDRWRLSHIRSGTALPWCWTTRKAALTFAAAVADFTDWTLPKDEANARLLPAHMDDLLDAAADTEGIPHSPDTINGSCDHEVSR